MVAGQWVFLFLLATNLLLLTLHRAVILEVKTSPAAPFQRCCRLHLDDFEPVSEIMRARDNLVGHRHCWRAWWQGLDFLLTTSCAFCGSTCRRSGWWWSSRRRRRSLPSHCDDQSIVRHFERDNTMWRTFDPSVVTCNPKVKIRGGRRQWRRGRYPDQI